jgi:hypothetical protein
MTPSRYFNGLTCEFRGELLARGRPSVRTWLYRIAINSCLTAATPFDNGGPAALVRPGRLEGRQQ